MSQASGFRLVTLGRLALVTPAGGEDESLAKRRRKLALLVVLALSRRPLSRDALVAMFWGDQDEERARHSLADALSHLRRVLGREAITTRQAEVALGEETELEVDALELAHAVADREWERAVRLYSGPFLEGVFVSGSVEFEQWAARERLRLEELFLKACAGQCLVLARARRWEECGALAARWLERAPLSSDAALYWLNALKAPGTRDAEQRALEAYERLAERLGREYDRARTARWRPWPGRSLGASRRATPLVSSAAPVLSSRHAMPSPHQ